MLEAPVEISVEGAELKECGTDCAYLGTDFCRLWKQPLQGNVRCADCKSAVMCEENGEYDEK